MTKDIQVCSRDQLAEFEWQAESEPFRRWCMELLEGSSQGLVANCDTEFSLCRAGDHVMPISANSFERGNSYVCSTYCGAISYPLFELREVANPLLRTGLRILIHAMAPLLRSAQIDRAICVNNWLISTNLYPNWNGEGLCELTKNLVKRYPNQAVLFRSLNFASNATLCNKLVEAGYHLAPSRQVYLYPADGSHLRRPNCRRDNRLLREVSNYQLVYHDKFEARDDARVKELYDMLYLEKYSPLNPQFTQQLIRLWRETRSLRYYGLRSPSGSLDGVVGCLERGGILTTPLVGYDTSLPQGRGLYRMLMAIVMQESARMQLTLNLSSGAASFKRHRGGKPSIEYTAIYCKHLPGYRRLTWRILSGLLVHVGARVLKELEL